MSSKKKSVKENNKNTSTTTTTTTTTTTSTGSNNTTPISPISSPSSTSSIRTRSSNRSPTNTLSPNLRMDGLDIESDEEEFNMEDEDYTTDEETDSDQDYEDDQDDIDEEEKNETQVVKRKKGRPPGKKPECCHICRVRHTPEWRKGYIEINGIKQKVDLCNACGLHNSKQRKKEEEFKKKNNIKKLLNDD